MKPIYHGECETLNSIEFYNDEMKFLIQTDKKLEARSCKDNSLLWKIDDFSTQIIVICSSKVKILKMYFL